LAAANDTVIANVVTTAAIHDDITNISANNVTVHWRVIATSFPSDWLTGSNFGICDNNLCRSNQGDTLLWKIAGSTTGSTFTSSPYAPGTTGTFDLTMDLSSATTGGTHWVTVEIKDQAAFYTKNATFIINKVPASVTNVNSTDNDVVMYPNPARDELNVLYNVNADVKTIAVYNIIGKVMAVYKVSGSSANLNLENVPSGIYFVRLTNSHGDAVVTRKFTKQ
jgi:hypothetical protein